MMRNPSRGSLPTLKCTRALLVPLLSVAACGDDDSMPDGGPPPPDVSGCTADQVAALRELCSFPPGSHAQDSLCMDDGQVEQLRSRIETVVVVMQENRPFDHYFATLSETHPEVEPLPRAPTTTTSAPAFPL